MKDNNLYDNTKIILVSDHALSGITTHINNDFSFAIEFNALLAYKDFNSHGKVKIDTNFMTVADVPYLATKHIPNIKNQFNGNLITNDYKKNGVYIIYPNSLKLYEFPFRYDFDQYLYVKDNIFDTNNWKRFKIDWKTKSSKEIRLK